MKEIKKDKVFQYTGMYIPVEIKRPKFFIDAFKRKILYFVGNTFMIKNSFKYVDSFMRINEIIYNPLRAGKPTVSTVWSVKKR